MTSPPSVRSDAGAYERYLRGMEASMRQKVAVAAAFLLGRGTVADLGCGSGGGAAALAALHPGLDVVGVDLDPGILERARTAHSAPNLRFVPGDVATDVFPEGSLDAVFASSVLHHVTTFSAYDHEAAARALAAHVRQLRVHGTLIVRDFVDPGGGEVLLDLPDDGRAGDDPRTCSPAALLVRFSKEFRKLSAAPGFPLVEEPPPERGFRRFRLPRKLAAEFLLRKDYRADWDAEVLEEYTYFTRERFESEMRGLGLRVLASVPFRNPWIVRNRFVGKARLSAADGCPEEFPATNYLAAAEKVAPGEGVLLRVVGPATEPHGFLLTECWRDSRTGALRDLVRRPRETVDLVPWWRRGEDVFVLARMSYPRPILALAEPSLGGAPASPWVTEPITLIRPDEPLGRVAVAALAERAGVGAAEIVRFSPGCRWFPSPGGLEEVVRSVFVELAAEPAIRDPGGFSGFASSGHVRAIEARQVLRAAQVGALADARLEMNVHVLLRRLGLGEGVWLGEEPVVPPDAGFAAASTADLFPDGRRVFESVPGCSAGFLERGAAEFGELAADGSILAHRVLEWVAPARHSHRTVAVAILTEISGEPALGVDLDDLPAAQAVDGNSNLPVAPAWRLPRSAARRSEAERFVTERIAAEYGLDVTDLRELGGCWFPSPGATPESVEPWTCAATGGGGEGERELAFVPVRELLARADDLADGHLRVLLFRLAQALGIG